MITVEFKSLGTGTCGWCGKERDDIANVAFADKSFVGPLCMKDLQRALKMKVGTPEAKPEAPKPAVTVAVPANGAVVK